MKLLSVVFGYNRCQSFLDRAVHRRHNFLTNFPQTNQYRARVQEILDECYFIIMESEINRILFYINRFNTMHQPKALDAAWQRLADLNRDVLIHIHNPQIRQLQEKIRAQFDKGTEQRTLENLEQLVTPLQQIIRQKQGSWFWL